MQMTIYYTKEDQYLIDKIVEIAHRQRKSRSALILAILEQYLGTNEKLGEVLWAMGKLSKQELAKALAIQEREHYRRRIGEILIQEGLVHEQDIRQALSIQNKGQLAI